jgi:hypothetical protein
MLQAGRAGPWVTRKVGFLFAPFINLFNIVIALARVLGRAHLPQNKLFWEAISATQKLGPKSRKRRRQKAKQPAARQPVGCLAASAATTTLDAVAKKNSTNMLFMSTKPAAQ